MNPWHDFEMERITPEEFIAVIEVSNGSKMKYELDKKSGMLILDRVLFTSTHYPANYGFIPKTLSDDGDPLDVLVLCQESITPYTAVKCYPIGILNMIDGTALDEKIIAIPVMDPSLNMYKDISDLPEHRFQEIKHFFEVYKYLENKVTYVEEISHRDNAVKAIEKSINEYIKVFG